MTNIIQADFNGTIVSFQNDAFLNATAIAKHYGKQPRDYLKTEQTQEYIKALAKNLTTKTKSLVKGNQLVSVKNGGDNRGTWLHPKLAIDFARWLSAEFAVWCDEQIEKILHGQPKLDALSTVQSRQPLKDAVTMMVPKCRLSYSECYKIVHKRFSVDHIEELTNEQVEKATDFVHYLMTNNALEGELMPQQESGDNKYIGLAIMKKAIQVKIIQQQKLEEMKRHLTNAQQAYDEAMKCDGAVWDGLHESQPHLGFDKETKEKATKKANENFENWKLRNSMH